MIFKNTNDYHYPMEIAGIQPLLNPENKTSEN